MVSKSRRRGLIELIGLIGLIKLIGTSVGVGMASPVLFLPRLHAPGFGDVKRFRWVDDRWGAGGIARFIFGFCLDCRARTVPGLRPWAGAG